MCRFVWVGGARTRRRPPLEHLMHSRQRRIDSSRKKNHMDYWGSMRKRCPHTSYVHALWLWENAMTRKGPHMSYRWTMSVKWWIRGDFRLFSSISSKSSSRRHSALGCFFFFCIIWPGETVALITIQWQREYTPCVCGVCVCTFILYIRSQHRSK